MRKSLLVGLAALAVVVAACQPTKPPAPPAPTPKDVLVVGDSVGYSIGCALGDQGDLINPAPYGCTSQDPSITVRNSWKGACNIAPGALLLYNRTAILSGGECPNYPLLFSSWVSTYQPEVAVIWITGWDMIDRWSIAAYPPGCDSSNVFFCSPGVNLRWGGTAQQVTDASASYRPVLTHAIDILRSGGAKVLVVNSPYYNPPQPLNPGPNPVYYEKYQQAGGVPYVTPNQATNTFTPSKLKVENFNLAVEQVVDGFGDPDVQLFDIWTEFSPLNTNGGQRGYSDYVCTANHALPLDQCPLPAQQRIIRWPDGSHLSEQGTVLLGQLIVPVISDMLNS